MKRSRPQQGVAWYLGAIQYCICLFGGGALFFLILRLTGFFWGDPTAQIVACLLLVIIVLAESWWAYMPTAGSGLGEFIADLLTSLAIVAFGMAVVIGILAWLPL